MKFNDFYQPAHVHPTEKVKLSAAEEKEARHLALTLVGLPFATLSVMLSGAGREIVALRDLREWTASGTEEDEHRVNRLTHTVIAYRAVKMAMARG